MAKNDTIPHDFQVMAGNGQLTYSASNTVGHTSLCDYTCYGTNAQFWLDYKYNAAIAINLPRSGNQVITSAPVDNLWKLDIWHYTATAGAENVEVYYGPSADGPWTQATGDAISYGTYRIEVTLPVGSYCFKIRNSATSNFSIIRMFYICKPPCNCLRIVL